MQTAAGVVIEGEEAAVVTVALPLEVPAEQRESETAVMV